MASYSRELFNKITCHSSTVDYCRRVAVSAQLNLKSRQYPAIHNIMPVFYVFTLVHCTAFYSPATEALINNNNNNNYIP